MRHQTGMSMHGRATPSRARAFGLTLVELLCVLSVATTALGAALTNMRALVQGQRLRTDWFPMLR